MFHFGLKYDSDRHSPQNDPISMTQLVRRQFPAAPDQSEAACSGSACLSAPTPGRKSEPRCPWAKPENSRTFHGYFAVVSAWARLYTPSTSITFLAATSFRNAVFTTADKSPLRKADFPSDLRIATTSVSERFSPSPSFSRMSGVMLVDGVTIQTSITEIAGRCLHLKKDSLQNLAAVRYLPSLTASPVTASQMPTTHQGSLAASPFG